jgi:preprotein translocase subunit SecY
VRLADTIKAAWAEPELRQRILFIFFMFGVFVIGLHIQVPFASDEVRDSIFQRLKEDRGFIQFLNSIGGGALGRVSIFALGLNPYITSSIIMQLMTVAIPQWKKDMAEGGQYERMKRAQRTRILTLVLCVVQGFGFMAMFGVPIPLMDRILIVATWVAGAMMVLWLGEQIQEKGIGQGVSLMIFAGIVVSFPLQISLLAQEASAGKGIGVALLVVLFLAMTMFIVYFTQAQRRIAIQHMRRNVGGRMVAGGQASYLPIPVNAAGVIPIIFAMALIFLPSQFATFAPAGNPWNTFWTEVAHFTTPTGGGAFVWKSLIGTFVFAIMIFFFTYFYTAIQFNVEDIANQLKRSGAYIPGIRQGQQTEKFLDSVISRITFVGAAFLAFVSLVPFWVPQITGIQQFGFIGGTSLLIIVSVVLDLMRQIEANLIMRGYAK